MKIRIEQSGKGKDQRTKIVGDHEAFFWLLNAAGNARSGFVGNEAALDGGGVLELVPEEKAEIQPASKRTPNRLRAGTA